MASDEVNRYLEQIERMRSQARSLSASRSAWASRKARLERRLSEVQAIRRNAAGGVTASGEDARRKQKKLVDELGGAVKYSSHTAALVSKIEAEYEKGFSSDSLGSQLIYQLEQEMAQLQGQIENAQAEIARLDNGISGVNGSIRSLSRSLVVARTRDSQ